MKLILEVTVTTEPGNSFGVLRFSSALQKIIADHIEEEGALALVNVSPVMVCETGKALE